MTCPRVHALLFVAVLLFGCARTELDFAPGDFGTSDRDAAGLGSSAGGSNPGDPVSGSTTTGGGAGGEVDAPTAGSGESGNSTGPASPTNYCLQLKSDRCDHAFRCIPPEQRDYGFVATFGATFEDCKRVLGQPCSLFAVTCLNYSASLGESCLRVLAVETCAEYTSLTAEWPPACANACNP
jgi:hypothetical protein